MKKVFRQLTIITMIVFIVIAQMSTVAFAAATIPSATSDFYVNDFAGIFSEEQKTDLMNRAVNLAETTDGIQVVITTVETLEGYTVEEYANEMYNQYEIGKDDMGLLILLSTGDRQIRVEVGRNMEAYVNDSKAGRFMDEYAIPYLKDNKFGEGLISLQTELIAEVEEMVALEEASLSANPEAEKESAKIPSEFFIIGIGVIFLIGIAIIIAKTIIDGKKEIRDQDQTIQELKARILKFQNQNSQEVSRARSDTQEISRMYQELEERYETLKDRYQRGTVLFRDLDDKVDAMIEEEIRQRNIAAAASVDAAIQGVFALPADRKHLKRFKQTIEAYRRLNESQKRYLKLDIQPIQRLYEESEQLEYQHLAHTAVEEINAIIAGISIGKERHIRELKKAKRLYEDLSYNARKYVASSIPNQIEELLRQANRDKREREEEEERRRESYSYDSFEGSSDGFSGFGGDSGGGGASRGF